MSRTFTLIRILICLILGSTNNASRSIQCPAARRLMMRENNDLGISEQDAIICSTLYNRMCIMGMITGIKKCASWYTTGMPIRSRGWLVIFASFKVRKRIKYKYFFNKIWLKKNLNQKLNLQN